MIRIITSSKTIEDKKTIEVVIMIAIEGEIILMDRNIEMQIKDNGKIKGQTNIEEKNFLLGRANNMREDQDILQNTSLKGAMIVIMKKGFIQINILEVDKEMLKRL